MARTWMTPGIAARMLGGLALTGLAAWAWFVDHRLIRGAAVAGPLILAWGLGAIGDKKNEWERPD